MDALLKIAACLLADAFRFVTLLFRSTKSLRAENLFLRRQLALFMERGVQPRRMWGEERIANELLVKLGIRVSPRTVGKYTPKGPEGEPRGDQRWSTFLKNHARAILACDFFVAVTATFRLRMSAWSPNTADAGLRT
jgi:putative transposase